jgi:hypothetical protein
LHELCECFAAGCRASPRRGLCLNCVALRSDRTSDGVARALRTFRHVLGRGLSDRGSSAESREAFIHLFEDACVQVMGRNDLRGVNDVVRKLRSKLQNDRRAFLRRGIPPLNEPLMSRRPVGSSPPRRFCLVLEQSD